MDRKRFPAFRVPERSNELFAFLLIVMIAYLAVFIGVIRAISVYWPGWLDNSNHQQLVNLCCFVFQFALLWYVLKVGRLDFSSLGLHAHRWKVSLYHGLQAGLVLLILLTLVKWLLQQLHIIDPAEPILAFKASDYAWSYPLVVFGQEVLARGFFLPILYHGLPVSENRGRMSIIVTACFFAMFHLHYQPAMILAALVLGLVLGVVYVRSGNLLGSFICHLMVGWWALDVLNMSHLLS